MSLGDKEAITTVKGKMRDINGKTIGIYNENILLDTRLYELELLDGAVEELAANAIAENLWVQ